MTAATVRASPRLGPAAMGNHPGPLRDNPETATLVGLTASDVGSPRRLINWREDERGRSTDGHGRVLRISGHDDVRRAARRLGGEFVARSSIERRRFRPHPNVFKTGTDAVTDDLGRADDSTVLDGIGISTVGGRIEGAATIGTTRTRGADHRPVEPEPAARTGTFRRGTVRTGTVQAGTFPIGAVGTGAFPT